MPKFSQDSFSKLVTCHPDLQALFYEVIKYYDCTILEGYRNEIDQNIAFKSGQTLLNYPDSKHNKQPSLAVNVTPYPIDFDNHTRLYWFAGYVCAIAQKLKDSGKMTYSIRWGGAWDGLGDLNKSGMFQDLVHYELVT
jgi:peptidoglycan LD-endopeptidase CwlK